MQFTPEHLMRGATIALCGASKSGKTSALLPLIEDGWTLHYIDLDRNLQPFSRLTPAQYANLKLYRPDISPTNLYTVMMKFIVTGVLNICEEHGTFGCKTCSTVKAPFETTNFRELTGKNAIVIDSYTVLFEAIKATIVAINGIDITKITKVDLGFHNAVKLVSGRLFHGLIGLNANVPLIIITHLVDINDGIALDSSAKKTPMYIPILGSRSFSRLDGVKMLSAVVAMDEAGTLITEKGKGYLVNNSLVLPPDVKTFGDYMEVLLKASKSGTSNPSAVPF